MAEFRSTTFARLTVKIGRAEDELSHLVRHATERRDAILGNDWEATTAAATGVHNVYNGIEDILLTLAKDIDGDVLEGGAAYQDLLDQMAAVLPGIRGALLSRDLHRDLTEIKNFRHLVRHRYGIELAGSKVADNVDLIRRTFPIFVAALQSLETSLLSEPDRP